MRETHQARALPSFVSEVVQACSGPFKLEDLGALEARALEAASCTEANDGLAPVSFSCLESEALWTDLALCAAPGCNEAATAKASESARARRLDPSSRASQASGEKASQGSQAAQAAPYTDAEFAAIAELGYHYLASGGLRLAQVIFEGLSAVRPDSGYAQLALALTYDYLGEATQAHVAYQRAMALDPSEARAPLNRAERFILDGKARAARPLLKLAIQKAQAAGETGLVTKARLLLARQELS